MVISKKLPLELTFAIIDLCIDVFFSLFVINDQRSLGCQAPSDNQTVTSPNGLEQMLKVGLH